MPAWQSRRVRLDVVFVTDFTPTIRFSSLNMADEFKQDASQVPVIGKPPRRLPEPRASPCPVMVKLRSKRGLCVAREHDQQDSMQFLHTKILWIIYACAGAATREQAPVSIQRFHCQLLHFQVAESNPVQL